MKTCTCCKQSKNESEFNKDSRKTDGLRTRCRACDSSINKASYFKHREKRITKIREYKNLHISEFKEYQKQWAKNNPEKIRAAQERYKSCHDMTEYNRQYRKKNLEKQRRIQRDSARKRRKERGEEYRIKNRNYAKTEKGRANDRVHGQIKRARKRSAPGSFTQQDINNIYHKQSGLCYWCKKDLCNVYHIDHYIPLSRGGSNFPDNIVLACPHCNIGRNNKLPDEFIKYLQTISR